MVVERLPGLSVYWTAVLAFVIPYSIYKINDKLHQLGDPPWKKNNKQDQGNN
jgi:hypothetical protein